MRLINSQRAGGDALPAAARLQPCTARHARARPAPADQDACALPPAAPPAAPAAPLRRRAALALLAAAAAARSFPARAASARVPPPPPELGEAGGTLNDCDDNRISCASSMSDDERFFYNPWEYSGPRDAAVERLVSVRVSCVCCGACGLCLARGAAVGVRALVCGEFGGRRHASRGASPRRRRPGAA